MKRDYKNWLIGQGYGANTIAAQLHRVGRVEEHYGALDTIFEKDGLHSLILALTYSTNDERLSKPNPTKIPFVGNIRSNLASYKSSVLWYRRFRQSDLRTSQVADDELRQQSPVVEPARKPAKVRPSRLANAALGDPRTGPRTLVDFRLDGRASLEAIIADSQYRTIAQAVASLTLFSHPLTVRQTNGRAIFPSIRNARRVGQIDEHLGRQVLLDDNKSPKDAFLWANGLSRRGPDTQFNHVYAVSSDVDAYTALPNICMTPAFIAKLTDTSEDVRNLLRYRCFQLYDWTPAGYAPPDRPDDYASLEWAVPLPPVHDVQAALTAAMATKPRDRTVLAVRQLGWLFGESVAPAPPA